MADIDETFMIILTPCGQVSDNLQSASPFARHTESNYIVEVGRSRMVDCFKVLKFRKRRTEKGGESRKPSLKYNAK